MEKIFWENTSIIWTNGNGGPKGGYVDIWELSQDFKTYKHIRRICFVGYPYALSKDLKYLTTKCCGPNDISVFDTAKKQFPDDDEYMDLNPVEIKIPGINFGEIEKMKFTNENNILVFTKNEIYEVEIQTKKIEEVSSQRFSNIIEKIKLPKYLEIKYAGKNILQEVLDWHCESEN